MPISVSMFVNRTLCHNIVIAISANTSASLDRHLK